MFFSPATLAFVAMLSLTGVLPSGDVARGAAAAAPRVPARAPGRAIAAGTKLWAPKKSRAASEEDSNARVAREEELLLKPRNAPAAPPRSHKRIKMEAAAASDDEGESDDEDEDRPKVSKRHKSSDEDEDDDDDDDEEGPGSLPSVAPRLLAFGVGTSFLHRTFTYDAPLQGDNGFRLGYALSIESYPLLITGPGWQRGIGIGVQYASEVLGSAGVHDPDSDALVSYPVKQGRLGIDLRYAIALGTHVVIVPAFGYGKLSVDLQSPTPVIPSSCPVGNPLPCFGDVSASHLTADLHLRIAFTEALAVSLVGGFYRGLSVSRAMGGIASEVPASSNGFHVEPALSLMLGDWFALQAAMPILRNSYRFGRPANGDRMYSSATETYYGVVFGVVALVP